MYITTTTSVARSAEPVAHAQGPQPRQEEAAARITVAIPPLQVRIAGLTCNQSTGVYRYAGTGEAHAAHAALCTAFPSLRLEGDAIVSCYPHHPFGALIAQASLALGVPMAGHVELHHAYLEACALDVKTLAQVWDGCACPPVTQTSSSRQAAPALVPPGTAVIDDDAGQADYGRLMWAVARAGSCIVTAHGRQLCAAWFAANMDKLAVLGVRTIYTVQFSVEQQAVLDAYQASTAQQRDATGLDLRVALFGIAKPGATTWAQSFVEAAASRGIRLVGIDSWAAHPPHLASGDKADRIKARNAVAASVLTAHNLAQQGAFIVEAEVGSAKQGRRGIPGLGGVCGLPVILLERSSNPLHTGYGLCTADLLAQGHDFPRSGFMTGPATFTGDPFRMTVTADARDVSPADDGGATWDIYIRLPHGGSLDIGAAPAARPVAPQIPAPEAGRAPLIAYNGLCADRDVCDIVFASPQAAAAGARELQRLLGARAGDPGAELRGNVVGTNCAVPALLLAGKLLTEVGLTHTMKFNEHFLGPYLKDMEKLHHAWWSRVSLARATDGATPGGVCQAPVPRGIANFSAGQSQFNSLMWSMLSGGSFMLVGDDALDIPMNFVAANMPQLRQSGFHTIFTVRMVTELQGMADAYHAGPPQQRAATPQVLRGFLDPRTPSSSGQPEEPMTAAAGAAGIRIVGIGSLAAGTPYPQTPRGMEMRVCATCETAARVIATHCRTPGAGKFIVLLNHRRAALEAETNTPGLAVALGLPSVLMSRSSDSARTTFALVTADAVNADAVQQPLRQVMAASPQAGQWDVLVQVPVEASLGLTAAPPRHSAVALMPPQLPANWIAPVRYNGLLADRVVATLRFFCAAHAELAMSLLTSRYRPDAQAIPAIWKDGERIHTRYLQDLVQDISDQVDETFPDWIVELGIAPDFLAAHLASAHRVATSWWGTAGAGPRTAPGVAGSRPATVPLGVALPVASHADFSAVVWRLVETGSFVLGEFHESGTKSQVALEFLAQNMEELARAGVTRVYTEYIETEHQTAFDAAVAAGEEEVEQIPPDQRGHLLGEEQLVEVVRMARRFGVEFVGIDSRDVRYTEETEEAMANLRLPGMNQAGVAEIVRRERERPSGKYIVHCGASHAGTNEGVPGIANACGLPVLVMQRSARLEATDFSLFSADTVAAHKPAPTLPIAADGNGPGSRPARVCSDLAWQVAFDVLAVVPIGAGVKLASKARGVVDAIRVGPTSSIHDVHLQYGEGLASVLSVNIACTSAAAVAQVDAHLKTLLGDQAANIHATYAFPDKLALCTRLPPYAIPALNEMLRPLAPDAVARIGELQAHFEARMRDVVNLASHWQERMAGDAQRVSHPSYAMKLSESGATASAYSDAMWQALSAGSFVLDEGRGAAGQEFILANLAALVAEGFTTVYVPFVHSEAQKELASSGAGAPHDAPIAPRSRLFVPALAKGGAEAHFIRQAMRARLRVVGTGTVKLLNFTHETALAKAGGQDNIVRAGNESLVRVVLADKDRRHGGKFIVLMSHVHASRQAMSAMPGPAAALSLPSLVMARGTQADGRYVLNSVDAAMGGRSLGQGDFLGATRDPALPPVPVARPQADHWDLYVRVPAGGTLQLAPRTVC